MTRVYALSLLFALAICIGGCGGGDSDTPDEASTTTTPATTASNDKPSNGRPEKGAWGVVFGAESEKDGILLYDLSGHTLYTFSKDEGRASKCYGACAQTWPPALTEDKPRADGEASPKMIGTTRRKDGAVQLTYAGHPLYTYSRDRSAEINGNGVESFGGEWYAIRPSGGRL